MTEWVVSRLAAFLRLRLWSGPLLSAQQRQFESPMQLAPALFLNSRIERMTLMTSGGPSDVHASRFISLSTTSRVRLHQPGRGSGTQEAVRVALGCRQPADAPGFAHRQAMTALRQLRKSWPAKTFLDGEVAGLARARMERSGKMRRVKERRVDRCLQIGAMMGVTQEEGELPLVLLIAAGGAEGKAATILVHGERWR